MSHDPDQFDLFTPAMVLRERAPRAPTPLTTETIPHVVFRFPLARRRKKVLQVASILQARKTVEGQTSYWKRTIEDLARELRRHGAGQPEIDQQLTAFHRAVGDEIARGSSVHHQPPGAA